MAVCIAVSIDGYFFTDAALAIQNSTPAAAAAQAEDPIERTEIERRQNRLLENYRLLEEKLFTLYQYEKDKNPVRSKLLEKAYQRSQKNTTINRLEMASGYLSEAKLKQAETEQAKSLADLNNLLGLLQSEDRDKRIRDELERYQEYLKEVERLLRIQKGLRGQAEGSGDQQKIALSEAQAADRAKKLADEIKKNEETPDPDLEDADDDEGEQGSAGDGDEDGEGSDKSEGEKGNEGEKGGKGDKEKGDKEKGDKKNSDDENGSEPTEKDDDLSEQDAAKKESKGGESSSEDSQGQGEGEQSDSDSSNQSSPPSQSQEGTPGSPSDSDQPPAADDQPQQNPIRKRIANSEDRMRNAQQELQQGKREKAVAEMKEAEKEIAEAKKQLEEILRQLREEEVERTLAMLEGRFRKMLQQQIEVKDSTEKLGKTDEDQRSTDFDIQTGKLATSQNSIATDASRALLLLREDGSSVAFPVTVEEMHLDMVQIAARLSAAKVGEFTVELENDVINTLNYLVDALAQAQKDNEEKKAAGPPPGGGQPQSPGENALVGKIAELKMLRGLQERIHLQHQRYAKALGDAAQPVLTADTPDLIEGLERLAQKQRKLTRIAQDIVIEGNK